MILLCMPYAFGNLLNFKVLWKVRLEKNRDFICKIKIKGGNKMQEESVKYVLVYSITVNNKMTPFSWMRKEIEKGREQRKEEL